MKLLQIAVLLFLGLFSQAQAQSLELPSGIAVDPAPPVDLTYQVVPSYDPNEKVLAGWAGDKLLYFITVEKLPPGWLNPDQYFHGLIRDLRAGGRVVEVGRSGKYKGKSTLSGQFVELRHKSASQPAAVSQTAHFLTDGKVSFIAFATLIDKDTENRMHEETTSLFKSAFLPTGEPAKATRAKSESPYVGSWQSSGADPNGNPASAVIILKEDLTFSTEIKNQGMVVFKAVAVWSVSGSRLFWTYMQSQPQLPDNKKEDEDEIVSLDREKLVLRSKLSGKEREFLRH